MALNFSAFKRDEEEQNKSPFLSQGGVDISTFNKPVKPEKVTLKSFLQAVPSGVKDTAKGIVRGARGFVGDLARSYRGVAVGLHDVGRVGLEKIFGEQKGLREARRYLSEPQTEFEKDFYRTEEPITPRSVGAELGLKKEGVLAPFVGFGIGSIDLVPGGTVSKKTAITALKNIDLIDDAVRMASRIPGISSKVVSRYGDELARLTDPKQIEQVIDVILKESQDAVQFAKRFKDRVVTLPGKVVSIFSRTQVPRTFRGELEGELGRKLTDDEIKRLQNARSPEDVVKELDEIFTDPSVRTPEGVNTSAFGQGAGSVRANDIRPLTRQEIDELLPLDREDYLKYIDEKLQTLPERQPDEVAVLFGGDGRAGQFVDTDLRTALNRGVNEQTNLRVVPREMLESTGNAAKDARGERLLKRSIDDIAQKVDTSALQDVSTELSTKVLTRLGDRDTVSKQFIADLSNSKDIREAERQVIRDTLEEFGNKVDVDQFKNRVRLRLLPLESKTIEPRYDTVRLPETTPTNYEERIYESPIRTSAGSVHFGDESDNYFAHVRFEDVIEDAVDTGRVDIGGLPIYEIPSQLSESGGTRRILEIQSDLFQKGRLETSVRGFEDQSKRLERVMKQLEEGTSPNPEAARRFIKETEAEIAQSNPQIAKLEPYRNTWYERVIQEEVQKALQASKRNLQFPTGETAMKIEGLGDTTQWSLIEDTGFAGRTLEPDLLKVGKEVSQGGGDSRWIITDVLGDGKFKAVQEADLDVLSEDLTDLGYPSIDDVFDGFRKKDKELTEWIEANANIEQFDISGKVDTENPIYRFYENEVGKYTKKKYGAKRVTDENGVDWWEVDLSNVNRRAPKEAFGGIAGVETDEEGNLQFDPLKGGLGVLGMGAMRNSDELMDMLKLEREFLKEAIDNNPAKKLSKFLNRNGELPQVSGNATKGKYARFGDDIANELGFADTEEAARAYEKYVQDKNRLLQLDDDIRELRATKSLQKDGIEVQQLTERESLEQSFDVLDSLGDSRGAIVRQQSETEAEIARTLAQRPDYVSNAVRPDSLQSTVRQSNIDVKEKIAIWDYLRTPDRVLKKIGLGDEAALLRTQYEKYLSELPDNIDKITAWSKRVSEEGNTKIFKYLDGQKVTLSKEEQKVAEEIQTWLSEWANRLKLPKDSRISHYITHIFESDFISKEFDPELAKIIRDKVPGSVYDPFLQERLGKKGYIEDTWRALDAYVKRGTRKVHMDPALEKIKESAEFLEDSQWKYVKKYVDQINMRPTDIDNIIDNSIKQLSGYRFGMRPTMRLTQTARRFVYRGLLGLNPASALRNLSQGANTYAKLGEKYTALGYVKAISNWKTGELERSGVLMNDFIQDRVMSASQKFWEKADKALFVFFENAEKINRGAAYYGAKARALDQGKTEEEAVRLAKKMVRDTQFTFGSIDTPAALQSDIMKVVSQFQTFTIKQIEFLAEMFKNKEYGGLLRYTLSGTAFVYLIGEKFGMEPKDLIPSFRFGTPPTVQLPVEVAGALFNTPDDYGNIRSTEDKLQDIGKAGLNFIPAGGQARKTYQGVTAFNQGGNTAADGDLIYPIEQTLENRIRTSLFGKYAVDEARDYYNEKEKKASLRDKYNIKNSITSDENIEKLREMPEKDRDFLIGTYATSTQKTIQNKLGDLLPSSKPSLDDIFEGGSTSKPSLDEIFSAPRR